MAFPPDPDIVADELNPNFWSTLQSIKGPHIIKDSPREDTPNQVHYFSDRRAQSGRAVAANGDLNCIGRQLSHLWEKFIQHSRNNQAKCHNVRWGALQPK